MFGQRWSPKGLAACYGSTQRQVALAESLAVASGRYGFATEDLLPRMLFAFEVRRLRVIDLTDGRIRQRLRVSQRTMLQCRWWLSGNSHRESITQAIGRAACLAGCEGLLVPTRFSRSHPNLVAFPEVSGVKQKLRTIGEASLGGND